MKICAICIAYPPYLGGIQRYASEITKRLAELGINISVYSLMPEKKQFVDDTIIGFTIYRILRKRAITSTTIIDILKLLKQKDVRQANIIHAFDGTWSTFYGGLISQFFKKLLIISVHGADLLRLTSTWKGRLFLYIFYTRASYILTNSFSTKKLLERTIKVKKVSIVYPGVNELFFSTNVTKEGARQLLKLDRKKNLLTVSRLVPRKGVSYIIKALPLVLEHFHDFRYIIIGDGLEKERLIKLAQNLNVADYVQFVGNVSDYELYLYYRACDVFILLPIKYKTSIEGFGMSFIEANACEMPVIGYGTGGVREAILNKRTGLLVDSLKPKDISKKIIQLFTDEDYRMRLGKEGRIRAAKDFNWTNSVRKIVSIYLKKLKRT